LQRSVAALRVRAAGYAGEQKCGHFAARSTIDTFWQVQSPK